MTAFAQEEDGGYDSSAGDGSEDSSEDDAGYYDEGQDGEQSQFYYDDGAPAQPTETTPFDDSVTISENEIVTLNVLANDYQIIGQDSALRLQETTEPQFGSVTINNDNTITYAPYQVSLPAGYEKSDAITYTATADGVSSYTGTVTVWIQQVNDAPVAHHGNFTIKDSEESIFYLSADDEDGDSLSYSIVSKPDLGQASLDSETGILTYTPLYQFSGKQTLTFQVSDGVSTSNIATVEITVDPTNSNGSVIEQGPAQQREEEEQPPAQQDNSTNAQPLADAGTDFDALAGDRVVLAGSQSHDPDGTSLAYAWSQVSGPSVVLQEENSATPTFETPQVEEATLLTFELTVSDGNLTSSDSVTVNVMPISIDIVPNVYPNVIDLSQPDAEVPVALHSSSVLGTESADPASLRLGPAGAPAVRSEELDSNGDGVADLVSYFRTGDLGVAVGDKTACFSGSVESVNGVIIDFDICKNIKVND